MSSWQYYKALWRWNQWQISYKFKSTFENSPSSGLRWGKHSCVFYVCCMLRVCVCCVCVVCACVHCAVCVRMCMSTVTSLSVVLSWSFLYGCCGTLVAADDCVIARYCLQTVTLHVLHRVLLYATHTGSEARVVKVTRKEKWRVNTCTVSANTTRSCSKDKALQSRKRVL